MGRAAILVLVLLLAAGPVQAGYDESRSWYERLPVSEREGIQADLTLLGLYDVLVDGKFGTGTYRALVDYQTNSGILPSGILPQYLRDQLRAEADRVYNDLGFKLVRDLEADADLLLPTLLLTVSSTAKRGSTYQTSDGEISLETVDKPFSEEAFPDLYASLTDPSPGRTIGHSNYSPDQFVVSGTQTGKGFYLVFYRGNGRSIGFSISWREDLRAIGHMVALYIASHFHPWETPASDLRPFAPAPKEGVVTGAEPSPLTAEAVGSFLIFEEDWTVIALDGELTSAAPLDFLRALRARPKATMVMLNSGGGLVDGALVVAHELHERGLNTFVPPEAACLSACAFIFMAGTERLAEGQLGVHQLWNESNDLVSGLAKLSDVLEAFRAFEVAPDVESIMLRTPPGEMHIFTERELASLAINQGDPFGALSHISRTIDAARDKDTAAANPSTAPEERLMPVPSPDGPLPANAEAAVAAINPANIAGSQSLLLEAPDDGTTGAVPFSGTVDWTKGTDETGLPTLIGKASIPARNLGVDVLIRKNSDPSLPASHLMEINFHVSDSFIGGSIAGLPGVLLKNEELVQGAPLVGASARVVGNSFLFALSASPEDTTANNALLTGRKWIDLAVIYATGKRAIITLERDAAAETMFKEVFDAWARTATFTPEGTSISLDRRLGQLAAEHAARNEAEEEAARKKAAEEEALRRALQEQAPLDLGLGN